MGEGTNRADEAPGTWGEDEAKIFVEFGRAMVPGREEIERILLDLIPAEPDEPFLSVEIGTGAGWLSAAPRRHASQGGVCSDTLIHPIADKVLSRKFALLNTADILHRQMRRAVAAGIMLIGAKP
jgi:hypothetical protein